MHLFSRLAPLLALLSFTRSSAQLYNPVIDVQHYDFSLALNDDSNSIRGTAVISVLFRTNATQFNFDLTARNSSGKGMSVLSVAENNLPVPFLQDSTHLILTTRAFGSSQHT